MSESVRIRPATPEDAEAMAALGREVAGQPLLVRYGVSPEGLGAELRRVASGMPVGTGSGPGDGGGEDRLLLAEAEVDPKRPAGRVTDGPFLPCGFARFQPRGCLGPGAYLKLIALLPGREGQGLGTALLSAVESEAARHSRALLLLTADFNLGAQRFYQHHGYRLIGKLPDHVRPGIAELIYYKSLRTG